MVTDLGESVVDGETLRELDEAGRRWERQPGETVLAYNAFCIYRDMGLTRTVPRAVREHYAARRNEDPETYVPTAGQVETGYDWAAKWDWSARSHAYDDWLERETRLLDVEALREVRSRQARVGRQALGKALLKIASVEASTLTIREAVALADLGMRLERSAYGESVPAGPSGPESPGNLPGPADDLRTRSEPWWKALASNPELADLPLQVQDALERAGEPISLWPTTDTPS